MPDSCDRVAEEFWKPSSCIPKQEMPSFEERKAGGIGLETTNAENMENYLSLLNSLVDAINNSNL